MLEIKTSNPNDEFVHAKWVGKKVLLALMPFWSPLIPPQGLARLKGFLQGYGIMVKTVDANLEKQFKGLYDLYFNTMKRFIPEKKWGNFYNIGNDVWREHMMAHINQHQLDKNQYLELVKILVEQVFYHPLTLEQARELDQVLAEFYRELRIFIVQWLEQEKPDLLGMSVYRDTLAASVFAFRICRELYPEIKTVMGGGIFSIQLPLGSTNLDYFLEQTRAYLDAIIVGEGETLLLKYLQGKLPVEKRLYSVKELQPEEIIGFAPVEQHDFSDFDHRLYNYEAGQASASCPHQCSFCNVAAFYGEFRKKDPYQTVREMTQLYQNSGTQLFYMLDSLLNPVIDSLSHAFIESDVALYWDGYFRVDETVDMEKAMQWRRGGFYRARIGVESGSQKVLDLMDKKITVDHIRSTITSLAYAGIKTTAYIVIGHPGETEEDFQMTLDLVEELHKDFWEVECNPFTYFYTGQGHSDEWMSQRRLIYPEWATPLLMYRWWYVDGLPTREELYDRVQRFAIHCKRLGVSVAWSLQDVKQADERWKRLHKHSVPTVLELIDKNNYVDECKRLTDVIFARDKTEEIGEFDF